MSDVIVPHGQLESWPLISPVEVRPQPVPTNIAVGEAMGAQGRLVVIQVTTPIGPQLYFMEPVFAAKLAEALRAVSNESGIVTMPRIVTPAH
jgi:hypothetical protein